MQLDDAATTSGPVSPEEFAGFAEAIESGFEQAVTDLGDLVRIPSISAPAFGGVGVQQSAEAVVAYFEELGVFEQIEILRATDATGEPSGGPNVVARRPAREGFPTVVLYAHHDVQPTGDEAKWTGTPFEPRIDGGRLYGRGASDDKAGVIVHLAALRALLASGVDLGIGITLLAEGEEEVGSPTFAPFLEQFGDKLAADVIVVADAGNLNESTPGQTISLRGIVVLDVTVTTLRTLVHSGGFGGIVPDALMASSILIASMYDADGGVAVEGLTRSAPLTDFLKDEAEFRLESTVLDGVSSIGHGSTAERNAYGPSITITGFDAPSTARASNVLLPSITFRIAARIAPGQASADAAAAIESHLRAHVPFGAQLDVALVQGGEPFGADPSGWASTIMTDALTAGWGVAPARLAQGGSIPFVPLLSETYPQADIILVGVGDDASRAHGIDESQSLSVLKKAITAETLFLAAVNARAAGAS